MPGCGKCHECGGELITVLDGEEWCDICQTYRRYRSHGWGGLAESSPCPKVIKVIVNSCPDRGFSPGGLAQVNPEIQRGGDLAAFWAELISALYDEDLARIIKCCPQPDCRQCVTVQAEMSRRKKKIDHAAL
jgi:hypothetical protein